MGAGQVSLATPYTTSLRLLHPLVVVLVVVVVGGGGGGDTLNLTGIVVYHALLLEH